MKTLIVYYSLSGNVDFIAHQMAEEMGADLLRLECEEQPSVKGLMKYIWLGKQVYMKEKPVLKPFQVDLSQYDLVILGTPVWAWSFVPAFRTFLSSVEVKNKKIALFCCHGGGPGKVFERFKEILLPNGNEVVGEIKFRDPLKHDQENDAKLAREWIRDL